MRAWPQSAAPAQALPVSLQIPTLTAPRVVSTPACTLPSARRRSERWKWRAAVGCASSSASALAILKVCSNQTIHAAVAVEILVLLTFEGEECHAIGADAIRHTRIAGLVHARDRRLPGVDQPPRTHIVHLQDKVVGVPVAIEVLALCYFAGAEHDQVGSEDKLLDGLVRVDQRASAWVRTASAPSRKWHSRRGSCVPLASGVVKATRSPATSTRVALIPRFVQRPRAVGGRNLHHELVSLAVAVEIAFLVFLGHQRPPTSAPTRPRRAPPAGG